MSDSATQTKVADLTFEQAQSELEQIVEALEDQSTGLESALTLWERGEQLHAHCQSKLDHAAARMEKLTLSPDEIAEAAGNDGEEFDDAPGDAPSMF